MRDLIENWRKPQYGSEIKTICANELEKEIPEWTLISADPATWPELDPEYGLDEIEVIARFPDDNGKSGSIEAFVWDVDVSTSIADGDRIGYIGGMYRHACDIDSPPEESK